VRDGSSVSRKFLILAAGRAIMQTAFQGDKTVGDSSDSLIDSLTSYTERHIAPRDGNGIKKFLEVPI
jgi:hypothetical protein